MRRVALTVVLASACGSSAPSQAPYAEPPYTGTPGEPIAVQNVFDTLLVPVSVNGVRANAIVDTGSPIVALDPSSFPDAGLPNGPGNVAALRVGALTFADAYVTGANLIASPDPSVQVGGSLGCGVLCDFAVSLNYRDSQLTLGPAATPSGVEAPGADVAFSLGGGGHYMLSDVPVDVIFPPSRILVTMTIEGTDHRMVVDTGSSFITLRQDIFDSLVNDGRTVLGGLDTTTVGMNSTSSVARLRSVVMGGEEVDGAVVSKDSNVDATLTDIASETGSEIDGLVGGSFLRDFFVTIDYPNAALHLQRYTKGGPAFDVFDRIGVGVTPASGATPPTVVEVFPGTNAATLGIAVGDLIVSVDGHGLATLGSTAIDGVLAGAVGSTKSVTFGQAASAAVSMKTIDVAVDDVLPLGE